jgi:NTP pyrophosphatase (non-canonical NTP hydrolase)
LAEPITFNKEIEMSAYGAMSMDIREAARVLTEASYGGAKAAGWHNDPKTGEPRTGEQNKAMFPVRIALCHSELSEALEGDRKDQMDDHLPDRKMAEVELADAVIRIFDLAGAMHYDLGGAIAEKLAYNANRADHKHAMRNKAGGKAY